MSKLQHLFLADVFNAAVPIQVDDDISSGQECKCRQGDAVLTRSAGYRLRKVCCNPF